MTLQKPEPNERTPLWTPDAETIARSNIQAACDRLSFDSYDALYRWSITRPAEFWGYVVERLGVRFETPYNEVLNLENGPADARWFSGATMNIAESCFQAEASATAILHGGPDGEIQTMTYGELRRMADAIAAGLKRLGLKPGDAVAVFLPMTARSVAVYLGAILGGYVVVSIADSFSAEQVALRLKIGQAKAIFTQSFLQRGQKNIALLERVAEAAGPRAILVDDTPPAAVALRKDDVCWTDFLADLPAAAPPVYVAPETAITVLFSSGTTGAPKAVPWDHATPIKGASDGCFHHDIHPRDVVVWPTNLGWMMGPWLIFAALINRAAIGLFEGSPLERPFGRFVQQAGVTMLGVVPSLVRAWRQCGCMDGLDWSSVRVFSSTGECSNADDMRYLSQLAGGRPIIEYCGGTEIGGGYLAATVVQPNIPSTFSTPALGNGLLILDEHGAPAHAGELFLIPPAIGMSNRLLNFEHHEVYYQDTPTGPAGETLRRHGDQMLRLPSGYYCALGRADDAMNLGGIKVGAAEIETALAGLPNVKEVAVICVATPGGGPDRLVVCLGAEASQLPEKAALQAELQQALKTKLNPLFKIHDVFVLASLPRTASNKIIRRQLRADYENSLGS